MRILTYNVHHFRSGKRPTKLVEEEDAFAVSLVWQCGGSHDEKTTVEETNDAGEPEPVLDPVIEDVFRPFSVPLRPL